VVVSTLRGGFFLLNIECAINNIEVSLMDFLFPILKTALLLFSKVSLHTSGLS